MPALNSDWYALSVALHKPMPMRLPVLVLSRWVAGLGLIGLAWWFWPGDEPGPVLSPPTAASAAGLPGGAGVTLAEELPGGATSAPRAPEVPVLSTVDAAQPAVLPHDGAAALPSRPVPLDRALRRIVNAAAAVPEPVDPLSTVLSDNGAGHTTYRDRQGRTGLGEWRNANVGPADVGLPMYPGSLPVPSDATRVDESSLHSLSMTLATVDPVDRVLAFYRAQLQQPGLDYQEQQASPQQWLLSVSDPARQQVRRVLVLREGEQTSVTVVLLQPRAKP